MKYKIKTLIEDNQRINVTDEFIEKNKLKLTKTQIEIVEKIVSKKDDFDFGQGVLVHYLNYEYARPFLKKEKVEEAKNKWKPITDLKECVQDFLDYMVFAWGKAENERGLSASRSVSKLSAWMWLLDRDDLRRLLRDDDLYNPYGSPALIKCCEELGIEVPNSLREFAKNKV